MVIVPRFELMAVVPAVRLDKTLKKELPLQNCETNFWSDSTAVLQSIYNSSKRFPVFVANRLTEVDLCSEERNWSYVPSKMNPADDVSRGVTAKSLVESLKWLMPSSHYMRNAEKQPQLPARQSVMSCHI